MEGLASPRSRCVCRSLSSVFRTAVLAAAGEGRRCSPLAPHRQPRRRAARWNDPVTGRDPRVVCQSRAGLRTCRAGLDRTVVRALRTFGSARPTPFLETQTSMPVARRAAADDARRPPALPCRSAGTARQKTAPFKPPWGATA
jgi:hypothetical protein